jgi:hypothetical protein
MQIKYQYLICLCLCFLPHPQFKHSQFPFLSFPEKKKPYILYTTNETTQNPIIPVIIS